MNICCMCCVSGVKNITALGHLIRWCKVEYDFSFHKQEFPANINVLVLSEGESMLPVSCSSYHPTTWLKVVVDNTDCSSLILKLLYMKRNQG